MSEKKDTPFHSGFISIIGRPNAGKSTFLNAVLGEKISIVSEKPQTTRNTIRGVKNLPNAQMIFIDTPGIHKGAGLLNKFMVREALSSINDVDAILFLLDASKGITEDDGIIIAGLKDVKCPVALGINKVDMVEKAALLPLIAKASAMYAFKDIVPISAKKGDGVDIVERLLLETLPVGPRYFDADAVTDEPARKIAAEFIREQVYRFTDKEVPYSVAVQIEEFTEKKAKGVIVIRAVIVVERDSQKGIIIGKGGAMLKRMGTEARRELEGLLGAKVFLELFVRVDKDWTETASALKEFGY